MANENSGQETDKINMYRYKKQQTFSKKTRSRRETPVDAPKFTAEYLSDKRCVCQVILNKRQYTGNIRCSECKILFTKCNEFLLCDGGDMNDITYYSHHSALCGKCYSDVI